ncbi:hypothetical protein [Halarcobacter bivalviorum]|uniref:Uncharacterized protein n=1 Tax=Halarcobacter bivalviorum TaxID=663364 RepID=A0AAX2AEY3_9BACT|nr:hypothetical protein [Halarcobacter bivalviorum]AXH12181.1 hypothetical protein ABIV_1179 [Halarcobacter bivalviorum]RXK11286.1 hypothetical protein CRV05_02660 [Halarcobacter bivalviorum]
MNRINPLYILVLLLTLFLISFNIYLNKKDEYSKLLSEKRVIEIKAKNFNQYKNNWFDNGKIERKIETILKLKEFETEKISKILNKKSVKIVLESKDTRKLQSFLTKFLNENLIVKSLQLERDSIVIQIGKM